MEETNNTLTWPTTVGAVCIVVGGLTLFGGCLAMTGMTDLEQLYTAIPFEGGVLSEELRLELEQVGPPSWFYSIISSLTILFSVVLVMFGMGILKQIPKARVSLLYWSGCYILFTLATTIAQWLPRGELVQEYSEIQGLFIAQLVIYLPMYLVLPFFLLIYLNRRHVRDEVAHWR